MTNDLFKTQVKDVMSREVVTAHPDDSIREALQLIQENRVTSLPAVDHHDHCVGVLSLSDLIDHTQEIETGMKQMTEADEGSLMWLFETCAQLAGDQTVGDVMTTDVISVRPEELLVSAAREMVRSKIHHLPVVDGNQRLAGIISTMDILSAFAEGGSR